MTHQRSSLLGIVSSEGGASRIVLRFSQLHHTSASRRTLPPAVLLDCRISPLSSSCMHSATHLLYSTLNTMPSTTNLSFGALAFLLPLMTLATSVNFFPLFFFFSSSGARGRPPPLPPLAPSGQRPPPLLTARFAALRPGPGERASSFAPRSHRGWAHSGPAPRPGPRGSSSPQGPVCDLQDDAGGRAL